MPPSATLIANLTTRQDLNYPSAAEVQSALEKKKGNVRDAVELLRKRAATQPRRTQAAASTAAEEESRAVSPPPLPATNSNREPVPAPAPKLRPPERPAPAPAPEPDPEREPEPDTVVTVNIDDRNPKNDKVKVFAEAARPIYQATRSVAVMSSYAPGGTELRKCNGGDTVQLSEVRTGRNGAKRGRIVGSGEGWVTIQLPNGTALFTSAPQAEEAQPQPRSELPSAAAQSSRTQVEAEVDGNGKMSAEAPLGVPPAPTVAPAPERLAAPQEPQGPRGRLVSPPELAPPTGTSRHRASTEAADKSHNFADSSGVAQLRNTTTAPAAPASRAEKMAELRKNLMRVREDASPVRSRRQGGGPDGDAGAGPGSGSGSDGGSSGGAARQQKLRDVIGKQGMYIGSPRAHLNAQTKLGEHDDGADSDTTSVGELKLLAVDRDSPDTGSDRPSPPTKSKSRSSLLSAGSAKRRKRAISFAPEAGGGTPGRDSELAPTLSVASDVSENIEENDDGQKGTKGDGSEQDSETEPAPLRKTLSPAQKMAIAALTGSKPRQHSVASGHVSMRSLLNRSASWRERAKMEVGRQKALESRTKVQVIQPEKPLNELVHKSTVKDTLYFTLFGFDKYRHWDDFEHLKEGVAKYIPGTLGLADLTLYCIAACCVLLSMFGVLPTWVSCTAVFALPHYVSDACTLEMITLKFCIGLSDLFRDFRVVGVWIGFFPGFLLVSCMDAVTFTAVKTRRTMTIFLIVVIVPLLVAVFVGIAKGAVPICPREIVCSRSLQTCKVTEIAEGSACGGEEHSGSISDDVSNPASPFGSEGNRGSGDTYTLISNLGLTTTALTTLIMFQLKYAFYWYKYRNRTMLLTVYMERSVAEADNTISLRGRSRQPSMWSSAGSGFRASLDSFSGGSALGQTTTPFQGRLSIQQDGSDDEDGADIESNLKQSQPSRPALPSFDSVAWRSFPSTSTGDTGHGSSRANASAICPSSSSSFAASMEGGHHELQRLRSASSLRVLDVCAHTCAQQVRNSLRESFSVPESEGDADSMAQWLDMAADAAATAAADALELELKEEENRLTDLIEESASDLAESPAPPDSPGNVGVAEHASMGPANPHGEAAALAAGPGGGREERGMVDRGSETATLMSPPALHAAAAPPASNRRAGGTASAANAVAILRL